MPPPRDATSASRGLGAFRVTERTLAGLWKFGIVLLVLVAADPGFMLRAPSGAESPWSRGLLVLAGLREIPSDVDAA
jgi:hypothetical protein